MAEEQPSPAERLNMACFQLSHELDELEPVVPEAAPLARTLLRVVGRVVIDMGAPGAKAEDWPNTEAMALQWIDEALRALGYQVRPAPEGGREELRPPSADW